MRPQLFITLYGVFVTASALLVVFLVTRWFWLWYWKVDRIVRALERIADRLDSGK